MVTLNEIDPEKAVCFSGHRPDRLPGKGNPNNEEAAVLINALRKQIENAFNLGKIIYLHGAMAGFDILAAEQVLELKKLRPQIRLITVAPYKEHFFTRENCWTPEWISRAREVFRHHDFGIKIAEQYRSGIYYERNRALVSRSKELICFWDGGKGGTKYTVQCAENKDLHIINLF